MGLAKRVKCGGVSGVWGDRVTDVLILIYFTGYMCMLSFISVRG